MRIMASVAPGRPAMEPTIRASPTATLKARYRRSEPSADAEYRPMLDHVELVALPALALGVVHGECPIADHPGERDAVVGAEGESVAADGLPGELASGPEPTD